MDDLLESLMAKIAEGTLELSDVQMYPEQVHRVIMELHNSRHIPTLVGDNIKFTRADGGKIQYDKDELLHMENMLKDAVTGGSTFPMFKYLSERNIPSDIAQMFIRFAKDSFDMHIAILQGRELAEKIMGKMEANDTSWEKETTDTVH